MVRRLAKDLLRRRRAAALEQDPTKRDERRGRRPQRVAPGQASCDVPQQALGCGVAAGPMELGCPGCAFEMAHDVGAQRLGRDPH